MAYGGGPLGSGSRTGQCRAWVCASEDYHTLDPLNFDLGRGAPLSSSIGAHGQSKGASSSVHLQMVASSTFVPNSRTCYNGRRRPDTDTGCGAHVRNVPLIRKIRVPLQIQVRVLRSNIGLSDCLPQRQSTGPRDPGTRFHLPRPQISDGPKPATIHQDNASIVCRTS